jgi:ATP-dependent DNA helicase DinG
MADLVRTALQEGKHAVIEAGTGIGKSFAYLAPIFWSGTPAVVSTSNKSLMNQLWEHDIPRLQSIAPRKVHVALLKGRGNYVCALRVEQLRQRVSAPDQTTALRHIDGGLARAPTGDVEVMRLPPGLASRLTVNGHQCRGYHCPHFDGCFYEAAKEDALAADIVVTNHALLCTSALMAENHILPVRPVLIIDEAHQLTRYAVEALTKELGRDTFWRLLNNPAMRQALPEPALLGDLRTAYGDFFHAVDRQRPGDSRKRQRPTRWALRGEIQAGLFLWDALRQLKRALSHARSLEEGEREAAQQQAEDVAGAAHALALPEPPTHVRVCEIAEDQSGAADSARRALYRPLAVASPLSKLLFGAWPRVICTSATLGIGHDLRWFQRQVGLSSNGERPVLSEALKGPFDYSRQMLLYTPDRLVPVYDEARQAFAGDYVSALTKEVGRLLEISQGRALVLCTSRTRMRQLYESLAPTLGQRYPCYLQDDATQPELVARFRAHGNAVLFATRGFWEGLDIPGEALALVVLDKIPFVPYDDPIIQRQEARIRARGGNPFYELQLASAILALRQGAGRLIRTETDRGVIALLDGRVLTKSYGRQIIQSLPEGCHTTSFTAVAAFLGNGAGAVRLS